MAGRLLKNTGSTMAKTELQSRLRALTDYIGNISELVWEDVQAATHSLARDLIESSSTIDEEWEAEAQPVRDFIKGSRIYISPEVRAEIENTTGSYDR